MVSIFLGIMIATLLMSAAPVYLDALERQSIESAVESSLARDGETYFTITTRSNFIPLEVPEIERTDAALNRAIDASVAPIHTGTERHLRTPFYSVIPPDKPVADPPDEDAGLEPAQEDGERRKAEEDEEPPPRQPVEGLVQSFTGLEEHITVVEGRLAEDTVLRGTQGPMVEVLVSTSTAGAFGGLVPGDVLVIAPSQDSPVKVSARIAGLIAPTDPEDPFWQADAESFMFPRIPNSEGEITPNSPPALGMVVSQPVLAGAVGTAFPGAAVNSTWYSGVDAMVLRGWSKAEMRARMELLDEELSILLSGLDRVQRHRHHAREVRTTELPLQHSAAPDAHCARCGRALLPVHDRLVPGAEPGERRRAVQKSRHRHLAPPQAVPRRGGRPGTDCSRNRAVRRAARGMARRDSSPTSTT